MQDPKSALALLDRERRREGAKRVVMLSIVAGGDVRIFKEAQSLAALGYQVIVIGRRLDETAVFETIEGVHYLRVDALDRPTSVLSAASKPNIHGGLAPVRQLQLAGLGLTGWLAGYSFATARVRPHKTKLAKLAAGLLQRYALRPGHLLSNYLIYQLEYARAAIDLSPDVIHAHDLYMLRAAVAVADKTGARLIYDAHELESDRIATTRNFVRGHLIAEERRFAKRADAVITVAPTIAREMQRTLGIDEPVLILNAPPLEAMPDGRTVRGDLGLDPSTPLVVFVGKVLAYGHGDHRIDLLIDAIKRFDRAHLAIVGPTTPQSTDALLQAARDCGLAKRFHIVAPVPYQNVAMYVSDADVGAIVMPPRTRNIEMALPNKFFEYALAGLPIVSFRSPQLITLAPDLTRVLVVDAVTADALADAISQALDPARRPTVDNVIEMRRRYAWPVQSARLAALYERLTGWPRPETPPMAERSAMLPVADR